MACWSWRISWCHGWSEDFVCVWGSMGVVAGACVGGGGAPRGCSALLAKLGLRRMLRRRLLLLLLGVLLPGGDGRHG